MFRRIKWAGGWILSLLFFRLVPLVLIAGIIWSGYRVAGAVARQFDERASIQGRSAAFASTATAMVIPTVTHSPAPTQEPPTPAPSDTPESAPTSTPSATVTSVPASNTPEPTVTSTSAPTATPAVVSVMQFATNTPVPAIFATNTPVSGGAGQSAPPSQTPPPTETLPPTEPPTTVPSPEPPTATGAPTNPPLPTAFFANNPEEGLVSRGTAVPTVVPLVPRNHDLVNILLLGGDDGLTDDNFNRTDVMIIVSINRDTGSVAMLSLPRDLFVWIPSGQMNRLNVAYALGDSIGWTGGGFGLIRQTILYNLGINVHYYARVDFEGFSEIIDTLGGVNVAVDCAYQDYALIGAEVPGDAIEASDDGLWTLPVGYYHMSGDEALWYVRTRRSSEDFDRGRRQQQVIRAMWRQIRAGGQLTLSNLPNLWNLATSLVQTDMRLDDIIGLLPLALNIDVNRIENYTLVRTYHTTPWQTPDGDFVQLLNYDTLRPLLEEFYRPPPQSRLVVVGASIAVYNGTDNTSWDRVAADRLDWEGFQALSMGVADRTDYTETVLIDRTGQQKASSLNAIARLLNVRQENIIFDPDPDREADFEVILGANYTSCDAPVQAIETP